MENETTASHATGSSMTPPVTAFKEDIIRIQKLDKKAMEDALKEVLTTETLKKKKAGQLPYNWVQIMVKTANEIQIDEITVKMIRSKVDRASLTKSLTLLSFRRCRRMQHLLFRQ